jgi:ABC-type multidrug transport system ATPase subunit
MPSLAAVDMHTATHIVQNCMTGTFARDRTIILVTHHISLCLPIAHYLVELSQGRVLRQGTIKSFEESGVLQKVVETEDHGFQDQEEDITVPVDNEADSVSPDVQPVKKARGDGKLIEAEARAEGRVSWRTYMTYIRAAGLFSWILTLLLMLLIRLINIGNQVPRFLALSWLR